MILSFSYTLSDTSTVGWTRVSKTTRCSPVVSVPPCQFVLTSTWDPVWIFAARDSRRSHPFPTWHMSTCCATCLRPCWMPKKAPRTTENLPRRTTKPSFASAAFGPWVERFSRIKWLITGRSSTNGGRTSSRLSDSPATEQSLISSGAFLHANLSPGAPS